MIWISVAAFVHLVTFCCCNAAAVNKTTTPASKDRRKFQECRYSNGKSVGGSKPEVYWINLNASVLRRKAMTTFLDDYGLPHFRVEALARQDLYVPDDLIAGWGFRCNPRTSFTPRAEVNQFENSLDKMYPRKIFVKGICGSAENNKKELVVVVSHLLAIRAAVYSPTATSRYALILEDDVWTPFDINFELLALELTTETGRPFGIVQLFNSKARTLDEYFHCFMRPDNYNCQLEFGRFSRWATRTPAQDGRYLSTWSTGAYLIDRAIMKPIIDKIFANEFLGWTSVTILAAKTPPCVPKICCESTATATTTTTISANNKTVATFSSVAPVHCVYAPVGFAADSYLYAAPASILTTPATTFTSTMPMFLNNRISSNRSTIHQSHVHQHFKAFDRMNVMIKDLYCKSKIKLPPYVNTACSLR